MCLMHLSVPVNRFGNKLQLSNNVQLSALDSRLSQNNSSTKIEGESVIMAACNPSRMLECNIIIIFCFHIYIYI